MAGEFSQGDDAEWSLSVKGKSRVFFSEFHFLHPVQWEKCLSCPLHMAFARGERSHTREVQGARVPRESILVVNSQSEYSYVTWVPSKTVLE